MRKINIRDISITATLTAIGIILPIIFHATQISGIIFLPMHIPVFLCGMICGPFLGAVSAMIILTISSISTGMPPFYPTAIIMAFELVTYAISSGILLRIIKIKNLYAKLYITLICAMLLGRAVYGLVAFILIGVIGDGYAFYTFITAVFIKAFPGIIIQLIIIPTLIVALKKARLLNTPPFVDNP